MDKNHNHIMSHEIFAYLKPGYIAQCVQSPEVYVFVDKEGVYRCHLGRRDTLTFKPELFQKDVRWYIVYEKTATFGGIFND